MNFFFAIKSSRDANEWARMVEKSVNFCFRGGNVEIGVNFEILCMSKGGGEKRKKNIYFFFPKTLVLKRKILTDKKSVEEYLEPIRVHWNYFFEEL